MHESTESITQPKSTYSYIWNTVAAPGCSWNSLIRRWKSTFVQYNKSYTFCVLKFCRSGLGWSWRRNWEQMREREYELIKWVECDGNTSWTRVIIIRIYCSREQNSLWRSMQRRRKCRYSQKHLHGSHRKTMAEIAGRRHGIFIKPPWKVFPGQNAVPLSAAEPGNREWESAGNMRPCKSSWQLNRADFPASQLHRLIFDRV